jgi:formylglycine-generating enzyme required for sulfatase activity/predicted DNA-binding protein with PD1-like motif
MAGQAGGTPTLPQKVSLDLGKDISMEFTLIPAGEFWMGSPESEVGHRKDELQHRVMISKPFYLGVYEVTQVQYELIMGYNPSEHLNNRGPNKPVDHVRYADAAHFCQRVSQLTGKKLRLPTEAEWERACRAGGAAPYSFGADVSKLAEYAWYNQGLRISHDVGLLKPSPWGLYDIHGNVWEWVSDWYAPYEAGSAVDPTGPEVPTGTRVFRGGCSFNGAELQRCAARHPAHPDYTDTAIGMRALLEVETPGASNIKPIPAAEGRFSRVILVRVSDGEDLLDSLQRTIAQENVTNAVFLSGIGSVSSYQLQVTSNTTSPPQSATIKGEAPYELVRLSGNILNGRVHALLFLSNKTHTLGGNLDHGCRVSNYAVITLGVLAEGISLDHFDDYKWQ